MPLAVTTRILTYPPNCVKITRFFMPIPELSRSILAGKPQHGRSAYREGQNRQSVPKIETTKPSRNKPKKIK